VTSILIPGLPDCTRQGTIVLVVGVVTVCSTRLPPAPDRLHRLHDMERKAMPGASVVVAWVPLPRLLQPGLFHLPPTGLLSRRWYAKIATMRFSWSLLLAPAMWIVLGLSWLLVPYMPLMGRFTYGRKWKALSQDPEQYKKVVRRSRSMGAGFVLVGGGSLASRLLAPLDLPLFFTLLPLILGGVVLIACTAYAYRQRE
jgi:hypothetical protein